MATLEKIRSKSVLLLIIIALALLAFILTDFFNSSRSIFGTGTTIAKVDGQSIDVHELQRRVQEAQEQMQRQGRKYDGAQLQAMVLNQLIQETLLRKEYERLGLTVTDAELSEAMFGQNSAMIDMMVQQQTGVESAKALFDMVQNPNKYELAPEQAAQLRQIWSDLEKDVEDQLLMFKFQTLFNGTLVANNLDAKALYDDNNTTSHIVYAQKPYGTEPDDKYTVTDQEINQYWNEHRNEYRLSENTRLVQVISVPIAPSAQDIAAGRELVNQALVALRSEEGTNGVNDIPQMVTTRKDYTRSMLQQVRGLQSFADSAVVGAASIITNAGNNYTLAKLLGKSTMVDSVNISFMAVQGSRNTIDSIIGQLNAGVSFTEVAQNPAVAQQMDSMWISLVTPDAVQLRDILTSAEQGRYFTPDTVGESARIFRVRERKAPVSIYDIATVEYVVEPSNATINTLQGDFGRYLNENKNAKAFVDNATKAGYTVRAERITPSSPSLGNLEDSRPGVAWAFKADKNEVSPMFGDEASGGFYALALEDVYDKGFTPATDPEIRASIENILRNKKKGEALTAQYKGKATDISGYANLFGAQADTTTVNFGQPFIPGIGMMESELTAAVMAAKPNVLVGPMAANNAVVVFTVTEVERDPRPYDVNESSMQFTQSRGAGVLGRNIGAILLGNKKVKNNTLKFYGEAD